MRSSVALFALVAAPLAFGSDARVEFLSKQLSSASDARVRVNAAVGLGALGVPAAIPPLCSALRDPEPVVRSASAKALEELADPGAVPCLKARRVDSSPEARQAIERAIASLEAPKTLYLALEPVQDESGKLAKDDIATCESLWRGELGKLGASFAPHGESKAQAQSVIRSKKLKAFMLRPKLAAVDGGALEMKVMVLTYPDQAIKSNHKVKAKGGKPVALLKVMVPKMVQDVAEEHEWK
ncbi:MAG: HEAT repeat domain-containing protein [Myxococcales bacterium]|nr:HEAT repeat domain-containing protein [Myxococcales bacterium]